MNSSGVSASFTNGTSTLQPITSLGFSILTDDEIKRLAVIDIRGSVSFDALLNPIPGSFFFYSIRFNNKKKKTNVF